VGNVDCGRLIWIESMECYFERDEQLYSVVGRGIYDRLSNYRLLSKNSAPCTQMDTLMNDKGKNIMNYVVIW
jgi:hypothetical protein